MSLQTTSTFPAERGYVLKLHRDARPEQGRLFGRLEHIASGDYVEFESAQAMITWLAMHAGAPGRRTGDAAGQPPGHGPNPDDTETES